MKLCDQCVTPVKKGVSLCKTCTTYKPVEVDWEKKAEELKTLVSLHQGKGKYDVMVPLTGGKDSSFVLYYMTKVLRVRVLAFTWNNKLFSKTAKKI
jgi:tRNA(Ile)-lysidine synthase TilS/MesJ